MNHPKILDSWLAFLAGLLVGGLVVEDPIDAAEMAAEMLDETGDLLDCREICVETEDESDGGSSWMLYVVAEMVRDYRARLTLPDFVSDPSDDDPSSDEMPT